MTGQQAHFTQTKNLEIYENIAENVEKFENIAHCKCVNEDYKFENKALSMKIYLSKTSCIQTHFSGPNLGKPHL